MALHPNSSLFSTGQMALIIAFLFSLAPMLNMAQVCQSPNGGALQGFALCDPTNSTSVCCKIGESCLGNGLCSTPYGFLYRGGCTDGSFKSANCPQYCIDDYARPWLSMCQHAANGSALYCCDNDSSHACCNATDPLFTIGTVVTRVTSVSETKTRSDETPPSSKTTHDTSNGLTKPSTNPSASRNTASSGSGVSSTDTSTAAPTTILSSSGHKNGVAFGVAVSTLIAMATLPML